MNWFIFLVRYARLTRTELSRAVHAHYTRKYIWWFLESVWVFCCRTLSQSRMSMSVSMTLPLLSTVASCDTCLCQDLWVMARPECQSSGASVVLEKDAIRRFLLLNTMRLEMFHQVLEVLSQIFMLQLFAWPKSYDKIKKESSLVL